MQADSSAVQPDRFQQVLAESLGRLDYDRVDTFLHELCDAWEESRHDQAAFVERVRALLLVLLSPP